MKTSDADRHVTSSRRRFIVNAITGAVALHAIAQLPRAQASLHRSANDLLKFDAVGLAQLIRQGELSAQEVTEASITRIEALEPSINALTTRNFSAALARAPTIGTNTVFAGVPTLLKDLVDYAGVRRTNGSLLHLTQVPKISVDYVAAMEQAGLNILGMTNTPEFASVAMTDNMAFGPTRNPWDLTRNAGGSSGGSAAAVAAGYVPLAHGTDGGGSNRIPASCCGVLGMKASRYRQKSGEADGSHLFLRTHQCLSRTVRDSAALLAATEVFGHPQGYEPVGLVEGPGTKRLRIAVSMENAFGESPQASVKDVIIKTMQLCAALGHDVVELPNPLNGNALFRAAEGIMLAEVPQLLSYVEFLTGRPAEDSGLLTPATVNAGRYAASLPADSLQQGLNYFAQLTQKFTPFFDDYDLWLTPTLPLETPRQGYISYDTPFTDAIARNRQMLGYTVVANGIGAPAMSVPLFRSAETGLPVGSHFMAAPGQDLRLYELAFELEAAQPWADHWPPLTASE